jgi:hypothetical protein
LLLLEAWASMDAPLFDAACGETIDKRQVDGLHY